MIAKAGLCVQLIANLKQKTVLELNPARKAIAAWVEDYNSSRPH